MQDSIKACPHCGGAASLNSNYSYKTRTYFAYVKCDICGASLDVGEVCDCTEQPRYNKVSVCVYPYKYSCKGCQYNSVPSLFDGGRRLLKKQAFRSG